MLNGKNWQTLVVGVADYGRERERLAALGKAAEYPYSEGKRERANRARLELVREFLGLAEAGTPFKALGEAREILEEALDAQQRLSIAVAKLEALSALYGAGKEED